MCKIGYKGRCADPAMNFLQCVQTLHARFSATVVLMHGMEFKLTRGLEVREGEGRRGDLVYAAIRDVVCSPLRMLHKPVIRLIHIVLLSS